MATLKRDSLVWRLLALTGGAFAVSALAVFLLVNHVTRRAVHDSSRDVYVQRVDSITRTLEGQVTKLRLTGQEDVYRADFQDAALRNLAQIHYADPDAEIFPFVLDTGLTILMHPRYPRGDQSYLDLIELPSLENTGGGELDYIAADGSHQWVFYDVFVPWEWVVGYRVPRDVIMADARQIEQRLIIVWTVVTLVILGLLAIVLRRETQPLLDLADAAEAMAAGDLKRNVNTGRPGEIGVLARSFVNMRGAIRRQLSELRESESRYRQIFDAMADGLVLLDQEGVIVAVNPRTAETYGWSTQQLVGKPIGNLLREEDQDLGRALRTPPADQPIALNGITRDHSSHELETEISAVRLEFQGEPHALVILRDVTEQRRLEHQLLQSQKLELVGRLAGGIAHDFNNLLTPVLGYSEMLLDDSTLGAEAHSDLEAIHRAGERARKLARQLLAFSRRQVLEMQDLDLGQTLAEFEPILRRTLREDIELVLDGDAEAGLVRADVSQVEQIVMNLAINAMDAMPDGGRITMTVTRRDLSPADAAAWPELDPGAYVSLQVSDDGHGIPPQILDRVFEPFFTTKDAGKGTGLGLATILGIAQQHGGAITAYNRDEGGCRMELLLPRLTEGSTVTDGEPESQREYARGRGETVVLVEDDDMVRRLVEQLLERHGYRVRSFASGQQCLDALASDPAPADLLLTDVVMPGINGPELRDQLHAAGLMLPSLFMSGYAGDTLIRRGLADARADFLQKPVVPETLLRKLRDMLARHAS